MIFYKRRLLVVSSQFRDQPKTKLRAPKVPSESVLFLSFHPVPPANIDPLPGQPAGLVRGEKNDDIGHILTGGILHKAAVTRSALAAFDGFTSARVICGVVG